ncbi:MAG: outer membrane protein assembly factor BamB [Silanimonas sp.]|nr:MAG: outer membrane protein assembly factor BamB [Silanimonas sp.]
MRKLLGIALVAALVVLPGCGTMRDWFRSDKSKATDPAPLQEIEGAARVQRLWSVSLGEGEGRLGLRQRPGIDGGSVYAVTDKGRLRAIDIETGKRRWEVELEPLSSGRGWRVWRNKVREGGLMSSVGVGEGLVVVAGRSGQVYAVSAEDGSPRWQYQASAEVLAAPLVLPRLVVLRSQDGRVVGLDRNDGHRRWSFESPISTLSSRGASTPAFAAGLVLVGNDDGTVVALRADDGAPIWEAAVAEPEGRNELERLVDIDGDLALGADAVYASSVRGITAAIALASGQVVWTRDNGGSNRLDLTADGVLLADRDGVLWSLDRASGSALWKQDALLRRQPTGPVLAGSLAVVGDLEGYLHWFDPFTGVLRARERVGRARVLATPLATPSGTVIAVTDEGRLAAFRLAE